MALLACLLLTARAPAENWLDFRGPTGQGVAPAGDAPLEWDAASGENIVWRAKLPGEGHSSPIVLGGHVWVSVAIVSPGEDRSAAPSRLELKGIALDRRSGRVVREVDLFDISDVDRIHSLNSYASPSPVAAPGRVYFWFGTYGTAGVDASTGEVLWRRTLPLEHYVGPGSSPVLEDGRLILTCDGADVQYVTALDAETGDPVWKTERPPLRTDNPDRRKSYCTPLVVDVDGQRQVIVPGAQWIVAYHPATGEELWRIDHGDGYSIVPRPVTQDGVVYFSTGFDRAEMLAVELGGEGDVTRTHVLWRNRRQATLQPSPVVLRDQLIAVTDRGIATARSLATGKPRWTERLGGDFSSSILLVGGNLYFSNRDGETTVLRASGGEPEVLAENQLEGAIMASPAVADGRMFIRTSEWLYCIGE